MNSPSGSQYHSDIENARIRLTALLPFPIVSEWGYAGSPTPIPHPMLRAQPRSVPMLLLPSLAPRSAVSRTFAKTPLLAVALGHPALSSSSSPIIRMITIIY